MTMVPLADTAPAHRKGTVPVLQTDETCGETWHVFVCTVGNALESANGWQHSQVHALESLFYRAVLGLKPAKTCLPTPLTAHMEASARLLRTTWRLKQLRSIDTWSTSVAWTGPQN